MMPNLSRVQIRFETEDQRINLNDEITRILFREILVYKKYIISGFNQ